MLMTIAAPVRRLAEGCLVGVMTDGVLHPMEIRSTSVRSAWREYELVISIDLVRRMGTASRVVGRICDDEWRLGEAEQAVVNELVTRIDEELAWVPQATSGGAAPGPTRGP